MFSKDRIIARGGFSRWWNIPAALCINLSIGQAYAFSVFNLPLTRVLGVSSSTPDDWKLTTLGWIFTLAYIFLGLSAGAAGGWQDRVGPRTSGVVAALCFAGGFFLSAFGVWMHRIELLYLGYGVLGGCGLGIGFNTSIPVL
ncbi:MAG TPA: MFS transporter, partial [Vicinamibacteria bacterium]